MPAPVKVEGLDISLTAPLEGLLTAMVNAVAKIATTNRETMSQPNRDRIDAVAADIFEDAVKIGRKIWRKAGLLDG
jgi:hypothetical protein